MDGKELSGEFVDEIADYDDRPEPLDREERAAQLIEELAELLGVQRETAAPVPVRPAGHSVLIQLRCILCGTRIFDNMLYLSPGEVNQISNSHACTGLKSVFPYTLSIRSAG